MIDLKQAIIGTDASNSDPRVLLLESGVQALRLQAGYVPQRMGYDWGTHYFVSGHEAPLCVNLPSTHWTEIHFVLETMTIRYPRILVWHDSVVFAWGDAEYSHYELRQLEVTRDALIELWESKQP